MQFYHGHMYSPDWLFVSFRSHGDHIAANCSMTTTYDSSTKHCSRESEDQILVSRTINCSLFNLCYFLLCSVRSMQFDAELILLMALITSKQCTTHHSISSSSKGCARCRGFIAVLLSAEKCDAMTLAESIDSLRLNDESALISSESAVPFLEGTCSARWIRVAVDVQDLGVCDPLCSRYIIVLICLVVNESDSHFLVMCSSSSPSRTALAVWVHWYWCARQFVALALDADSRLPFNLLLFEAWYAVYSCIEHSTRVWWICASVCKE